MTEIKLTKKRKLIYEIVENSSIPLTALDIVRILNEREENIWPSTVYRALEFLTNSGLLRKEDLPFSDEGHYLPVKYKHKHFCVCINCKKIIPIDNCPLDCYEPEISQSNFQVLDHRFMLYGYCESCKK